MTTVSFEAIGTKWQIDILDMESDSEQDILNAINVFLQEFDRVYSRFRNDSVVAEISRHAGVYEFPESACVIFPFYKKLYDATNGLVTPLIGNALSDAGYDAGYSFRENAISPVPRWEEIMEYKGGTLFVRRPVMLDFGACGKGYAVDRISQILSEELSVSEYIIDAGGDIYSKTRKPIRVGLEDPSDPGRILGVVSLANKSICASAGNRRRWGKFSHILSPKTLTSPVEVQATWVVAEKTMTADALATALFLVPPEALREFDFEYLIVYPKYVMQKSSGFHAELYGLNQ